MKRILSPSLSRFMSGSFKSCWISLQWKIKLCLQQLMKSDKVWKLRRARKHKKLSSSFDLLTSSFETMEVSGQLRQIFKFMDANGDGKISSSELSEVLVCFGYEKSEATREAAAVLEQMDYNGDGFIDLDEFMGAVDDGITECDGKEDYLMDAFLIFDTDKNGLISATELRRVLINLGCDKCSLEDCRRMIKGVDMDGDGFVDFEEFRSMLTNNNSTHK